MIYASITKVALVLHPREPAYSAAVAPLRDLISHVLKLSACALSDAFGATLSEDVRHVARGVIEALRAFAQDFSSNGGQDYLARTAAVHDLIDVARRTLPADNIAAVKKRWSDDRALLDDISQEIDDIITGDEFKLGDGDKDGDDDQDDDDEWDELFATSGKKMTTIQVERAKKVNASYAT